MVYCLHMTPLIIVLAIVVVIVLWFIAAYNGFISLKNRVVEAWADIDVQLKRRYDLIPNLVETVKGYASHESKTLEAVIAARNSAMGVETSGNAGQVAMAENALAGTLKSLFALSENYPDLKANTGFVELQKQLADTEDKIQAARRFYNGNVRDYNTKRETFPSVIVANMFGFAAKDLFDLADAPAERENVQVKF